MPSIFIFVGILLVVGFIIIIYGLIVPPPPPSKRDEAWLRRYAWMLSNSLFKEGLEEVTRKFKKVSVYTIAEVYVMSAKAYIKRIVTVIAFAFVAVFLFNDVITIGLVIMFGYLYANVATNKQIDKINVKILRELRVTLSSLRQEYMRLNSVTDALQAVEYGPTLRSAFAQITAILTSVDGEDRLKVFFESVPYRHVQTLARICYDVNNNGDDENVYGQSNFIMSLITISSDVNMELGHISYKNKLFSPALEWLPIIPIFAVNPLASILTSQMPGLLKIYNGVIGYWFNTILIVMAIVCYIIITQITRIEAISESDRIRFITRLCKNPVVRKFAHCIQAKNVARVQLFNKFKSALSKKTIEEFYVEKVVWMFAGLFLSLSLSIISVQLATDYMYNTTNDLFLVQSDDLLEYTTEEVLALDHEYIARRDLMHGSEMSEAETIELIQKYFPKLTDLQDQDQVDRLEEKYNVLNDTYFRWWYLLVCYVVSFICYMIPNIKLFARRKLVGMEAENDFLQLQTLMTIIMNTGCDSLEALDQLTQSSVIHNDAMLYCYHSYPSNPIMELDRLASKTPIVDFKRFIEKFKLTVDDLSMAEAFSDLQMERDFIMKERDMEIRHSLESKRTLAGMASRVPMYVLLVLDFLFPILYLGVSQFMHVFEELGNM